MEFDLGRVEFAYWMKKYHMWKRKFMIQKCGLHVAVGIWVVENVGLGGLF